MEPRSLGPEPSGTAPLRALAVAAALLLSLLLASAPYVYGAAVRPPGTRFWAVPPVNSGDANQYLAFTHIAREGSLLIGDPFTAEPHQPRLIIPIALWEGLLCRLFRWTPIETFQASRVLFGALLLGVGWWFGTLLLPDWRLRRLYLGLLCFSGGAGWLVERLGWQIPSGDLFQPEGNTFFTLGNLPHLCLAQALLTGLFGTLPALEQTGGRRGRPLLLATFFGAALLSWTHPFDFVTLGLGLGSYGAARWIADRRLPLASVMHAGAIFLGALPAAAYLFRLTRADPVYRALADDVLERQPFAFYAIAHGLFVIPALAVLFAPEARRRYLLPLCWVLCVFLFLLTPFRMGGKQPRLLGGIHVPLALLAAAGTDVAARALARRRGKTAHGRTFAGVGAVLFLVTATGAWGMLERHFGYYAPRAPDFYISPGVRGVFRYLDGHAGWDQLTLGGAYTGGWTPTWADTRVYAGHWHMTLHAREKNSERKWLFTGSGTPEVRGWWLRSRGIDWVIWYPWEWEGFAIPLDGAPGVERVLTEPDVVLYHVQR